MKDSITVNMIQDRIDIAKKIQKLLVYFDLGTIAFEPGVKCVILKDTSCQPRCVDFDRNTWEFIEPLLRELLMYRRKYGGVSKTKS